MTNFKLKYGRSEIDLEQSRTLIGIRPKAGQTHNATAAVRDSLGNSWREAGTIGGFRIVEIADSAANDSDAKLDEIRKHDAVASGTHVFELPHGGGFYVPNGELYVEFAGDASDEQKEALFDQYRLEIKEARGATGFVVRTTPESPNPIKVAAGLQAEPSVRVAEPDLASRARLKAFLQPTDSLLGEQWHLRNVGFHRSTAAGFRKGADARVIDAWSAAGTLGKPDIVVAVIDDGFDLKHPDLAVSGKVVRPWDFTRNGSDPRPDAASGDWHGTACAGVAVAAGGGGGVVGAAPGCSLMPVRWGADLSDRQIENWFAYVTDRGADVVSCSWGAANPFFPLSTRAHAAIERCARHGRGGKGCVVVFAAGNSNHDVNNPAGGTLDGFSTHPDVIAVAASTSRDERSSYSNFGREISVCAPSSGAGGWGILTTDVTGLDAFGNALGYDPSDYTQDFGGTSSACPLVAGIAALTLSVAPSLTSDEVKKLLQGTARKIGSPQSYRNGHSLEHGHGCVDAAAAVRKALEKAQPMVAAALEARAGRSSDTATAAIVPAKPARRRSA